MDLPLRSKLLGAFVSAVALCGILTILAGSFLINRMVIGEAQRRIALALKTAHAMLDRQLEAAETTCDMITATHLPNGRVAADHFDQKPSSNCSTVPATISFIFSMKMDT